MTASLHKLGAGRDAGLYYTNDSAHEAKPRSRDEYYSRGGGGIWWTSGESVVAHGAAVEAHSFRDLCAGFHPATGKALVRGAGETHQAGLDVTFTCGKSVSVLWMAGTPGQREQLEAAHRAAIDRALRFILDEDLIAVRHGGGGVHRARPTDLIAATFDHFTTREGDPSIHTHAVCLNVAGSPPRSRRYATTHLTMDAEQVFKWKLTIGACYRAALAAELSELGFTFRPAGQGQWEIAGVPDDLLQVFSKRSAQIEATVGAGASSAQREIAALATRGSKEDLPTGDELEMRWRTELAETGIDPWEAALDRNTLAPALEEDIARDTEPDPRDLFVDPPELPGSAPVEIAASALFRHESVIDRNRLLRGAFVAAALQGRAPEIVYAELTRLEEAGSLIKLAEATWTTPGLAAVEAAMLRAANRPQERDWIGPEALEKALADAPHLSREQREAVVYASRSDGVGVIEAGAGTGKTTLAKAIVDAAHRSGMTVIGLAPSWVAADELAKSTDMPAQAIARWRWDQAQGKGLSLDASTLVVMDEAGMVGTRDMEIVLTAAAGAGAKVILLGDSRQLASVSGANAGLQVRPAPVGDRRIRALMHSDGIGGQQIDHDFEPRRITNFRERRAAGDDRFALQRDRQDDAVGSLLEFSGGEMNRADREDPCRHRLRRRPAILRLMRGNISDIRVADDLMTAAGPLLRWLTAAKGYDADALRRRLTEMGATPVIPGRSNRNAPIAYDKRRYRDRWCIEAAFCRLKDFRRVASRYEQLTASFLAAVVLETIVAFWV